MIDGSSPWHKGFLWLQPEVLIYAQVGPTSDSQDAWLSCKGGISELTGKPRQAVPWFMMVPKVSKG